MFDIKSIEKNKYFKEKILKKWEFLFKEWEFDQNIYIIKTWKLEIEKYFSNDKKEKKKLAILWENNIFWEWALSNNDPKEVSILALEDTFLYFIEAKIFQDFIKDFSEIWVKFLSEIINLSNKRLLESNFLLTSNYKISELIANSSEFSNKNLFKIIDEFENIINAKYIIFVEKNYVLDDFFKIIYDSRKPWKLLDEGLFEVKNNNFDLQKLSDFDLVKENILLPLKSKNKIIGFFIIWEDENNIFDEWQKKSIISIWNILAGFIKQKQDFQNEKKEI